MSLSARMLFFLVFLAGATIFVGPGCAPPKPGLRYTYMEIETYPTDVQEAIRNREVLIGMTPEQVRYALGAPESARTFAPRQNEIAEEWTYRSVMQMKTVYLVFEQGKVSKISTEQLRLPTIRIEKVD